PTASRGGEARGPGPPRRCGGLGDGSSRLQLLASKILVRQHEGEHDGSGVGERGHHPQGGLDGGESQVLGYTQPGEKRWSLHIEARDQQSLCQRLPLEVNRRPVEIGRYSDPCGPESLALPGLRGRMVDLEDLEQPRKWWLAVREGIQPRAQDDVLPYPAFGCQC